MELLRVTGIEEELHAAGGNSFADVAMVVAASVTGEVFHTLFPRGDLNAQAQGFTPARLSGAGQDKVEPILAHRAHELGADVRFSTELISWDQKPQGIEAVFRHRQTGEEQRVTADYLVAADGNRSPIRERLGIATRGHGRISSWLTTVFESETPLPTDGRGFSLYYLRNPNFTGVYASTDIPRRATVGVEYDPKIKSLAEFTDEHCLDLIRQALGMDVEVRILEKRPWEMSSYVADRFISGRVFLAGDAAHTMPPTGGLGGQTAIQDGADLAWKLALVLQGHAEPALLQTYEAERKPVAHLTVDCQTANYLERMRPDRDDLRTNAPAIDYMAVALGYRYRSPAILLDVPDDGSPVINPFASAGLPGTRAPHLVISQAGKQLSTIDLFGAHFVLLAGRDLPDKAIKREALLEAINSAVLTTARKAVGPARDLRVEIDPKSGEISAHAKLTVVEKVQNQRDEISLTHAKKFKQDSQVGDDLEVPVTPRNFSRIAAQTAKRAMMQRIRQAEKEMRDSWTTAATFVAALRGLPLDVYQLGTDILDEEDQWSARYGLDRAGAVLIRPDGFIAWRSRNAVDDPASVLESVLNQVLGPRPDAAPESASS